MTSSAINGKVWAIRFVFGLGCLAILVCSWLICRDDSRFRSSSFLATAFASIGDSLHTAPDAEEMFVGAWEGMKGILDPYTNFIPASSYQYVDEENRGSFEGIGVEITVRDGLVTVISPIAGSHAEEIGLRSGDQVMAVDSVDVEGMPANDVTSRIRGPAGTTVLLLIKRPGLPEPFEVRVERRNVELNSVAYSGVVDSVGYIHLTRFSLTTPEEMNRSIEGLFQSSISGLILDLRGNPGGFMSAAAYVAGLFLPEGDLILATKSRRDLDNYSVRTVEDGPLVDIPLVILVNRGSASASEIVAGALQDHDRAVVIGDTTFGKGLVQTNVMLDGGNALRVTTSKYYLPSGRLVQRFADADWADHMEISRSELNTAYRTEGGRSVYGGGGVAPDLEVEPDSITLLATVLSYGNYFFKFAVDYRAEHGVIPKQIDDKIVRSFREYVYERGFEFPDILGAHVEALSEKLADATSSETERIIRRMEQKASLMEESAWQDSDSYIRRTLVSRFARVRGGIQEVYAASRMVNDRQIRAAIEVLRNINLYRELLNAD